MDLTTVHVDVAAYETNIRLLTEAVRARAPQTELMAVLKADGYGHGIRRLAGAAVRGGAAAIGIVDNWEAAVVRGLGLQVPLVRLRPTLPAEALEAMQWGVEEVVGNLAGALQLAELGASQLRPVRVHVMLDSGMNRSGFHAREPADAEALRALLALPSSQIELVSFITHFPDADGPIESDTTDALEAFLQATSELASSSPSPSTAPMKLQVANSATLLRFIATELGDRWPILREAPSYVRAGVCSYGLLPSDLVPLLPGMAPCMRWSSTIVQVREVPAGTSVGYGRTFVTKAPTRIATLPCGYADGYPRSVSGQNTDVLIGGVRCPLLGRVSMNLLTVDVTHVEASQGDEAVLLGRQGEAEITAEELAAKAGTINYEIVCSAGWQRGPR